MLAIRDMREPEAGDAGGEIVALADPQLDCQTLLIS
jgi:hypothetical protein